ncbi:MAG: M56 family metallopeptidase [Gammaproteobacteria bacterium]|nr:M56 family metallopeptidase [Gammaproteobacteria bacterium]MBU2057596.1 M56 family metallopeptidase [Gammaproteobacteria bacterium]MBU2176356.1 M56 family metallopeptidase [Gammaproteobacteria bacterium]MBU2245957.1 M56 family metallopeptidase [Gammaproteobacteria bacterium]MBU2345468.1 M56 family metallopeptidase [Gammaproteobacteria bacterium]
MISLLLELLLPLSLMLLTLLVLRPYLLTRLGARTSYALWCLVPLLLLCFVLPLQLSSNTTSAVMQVYQVGLQQAEQQFSSSSLLLGLWLAGVLLFAALVLHSQLQLNQEKAAATSVDLDSAELVSDLPCLLSYKTQGPYISGLFKAEILLPTDFFQRFSPTQQQLIIQHELTHWRRGDLFCNLLALVLLMLFWFNPLCWLAYSAYRHDQELACDALVLANACKADKIAYGKALLSNSEPRPVSWQGLTTHYGDIKQMKQRIQQLQNQQGFSKTTLIAAVAAVLVAGLWLQQPAQAAASATTAKNEPAPVMRVEPKYPVQAAEQQIEGYVQAKFDVSAEGKVSNVRIVRSVPAATFDKVSITALEQWQYAATGQEYKDMLVQLDYALGLPETTMERVEITPAAKAK